jgi:hypothetical protein
MRVLVRRFLAVHPDGAALFLCHDDRCPGSANRLHRPGNKTTDGRVLPAKFSPSRVVRPSGIFVSGSMLSPVVRRLISFDRWLPPHAISRLRSCFGLMFWPWCPSLGEARRPRSHIGDFHPISSRPCQAHTNRCRERGLGARVPDLRRWASSMEMARWSKYCGSVENRLFSGDTRSHEWF